ncbi:MAG: DUF2254 domain-containing protein [Planctomycetes bacterium]|nr:DUF2254 domain-containing protein [Planctomycetota bacterium]
MRSTYALVWMVICAISIVVAAVDLGPHLAGWFDGSSPTPEDLARTEQVVSACSRFLATSLSMLVALCALALPLTANAYTPRLIELFLEDRLNRAVLMFFVIANAIVLWNAFMLGAVDPDSARARALLSVLLTLAALLVIAPYFLYVLRFLLPQTIVARLGREVRYDFESLVKAREGALENAITNVQYIGKVTLRSIQRHDRDVAAEGLRALEDLFTAYLEVKSDVPPTDLPTATRDALGLGPELAQEVVRKDAVIEVAILQELSLLLPVAMESGVGEVVSQIAALTRRCGVAVAVRNDDRIEELITLYFNTFLRSALKSRNAEAFYKICYQYRRFATDLLALDPPLAERVTFFLDYYAHQAVRMNLPFLINVVAYDLAALCEEAYGRQLPSKERFLEAFIALDRDQPGILDMPGVVKAQIILAARLRTRGDKHASTQLVKELHKVSREVLRETFGEIVAARDQEHFWEIADRRRHLDHVEAECRPAIGELREMLLGTQTLGAATMMFLDGSNAMPPANPDLATIRMGAIPPTSRTRAVDVQVTDGGKTQSPLSQGAFEEALVRELAEESEDPNATETGKTLSPLVAIQRAQSGAGAAPALPDEPERLEPPPEETESEQAS